MDEDTIDQNLELSIKVTPGSEFVYESLVNCKQVRDAMTVAVAI